MFASSSKTGLKTTFGNGATRRKQKRKQLRVAEGGSVYLLDWKCRGRAVKNTEFKLWCFGLDVKMCYVTHVKEPSVHFIEKRKGSPRCSWSDLQQSALQHLVKHYMVLSELGLIIQT